MGAQIFQDVITLRNCRIINNIFYLFLSREFTLLSRQKGEQNLIKMTKNNEKHSKNQLKHERNR